MDNPRKEMARYLVDFLERNGLDPLVSITVFCIAVSAYYAWRWQEDELTKDQRRWNVAFWIMTFTLVVIVVIVKL